VKLYVITDLEGVAGIVLDEQTRFGSPLYDEARRLQTREINAAVEGALEGGATEIIVHDAHGSIGYNFLFDELHPRAEYLFGADTDTYLGALDRSFDGLFLLGMHSMAGTMHAVLEHTWAPTAWDEMRINGRAMGEIGLMAAVAGEVGVPTLFVTGDQAVHDEARDLLGANIETVVTKRGLSRHCAIMKPAGVVRRLIREAARAAVGKAHHVEPFAIEPPVEIMIRYKHVSMADGHKCAGKRRVDARTVAVSGSTVRDAFDNRS
jgi:D-amino peptidase